MRDPLNILSIVLLWGTAASPLQIPADSSSQKNGSPGVDSSAVILRFGGDCLLADHYEEAAGDSVDMAFQNFDLFRTADFAVVNLECPVTTRGIRITKPFNFRMHPRFLAALTSAGIDAVNLANNHIYDYGKIGLCDTFSYLDSVGMRYFGAGRNAKRAHAPVLFNAKGKSIAFFGYYGGGEAPVATRTRAGVAERSVQGIQRDIEKVRRFDPMVYVVVNLHWGTESADTPDPEQVEFAHKVINAGADLIIGHHPHVLQGVERYKAGVIVYSLGNLVFGGRNKDTYDTAVFEVRLAAGHATFQLIPIRIDGWRARQLGKKESEGVSTHVQEISRIFPESIFEK